MLGGYWKPFLLIFKLQVIASNVFIVLNFTDPESIPEDHHSLQHVTCSGYMSIMEPNPHYIRPQDFLVCPFKHDLLEMCKYRDQGRLSSVFHISLCPLVRSYTEMPGGKHAQRRPLVTRASTTHSSSWSPLRVHSLSYSPMATDAIPYFDLLEPLSQCVLPPSMRCDGYSHCLTDECNCQSTDIFYCNDNSGCISFENVCDGFQDCKDGSDECMCSDVIHCTFNDRSYCVPRDKYCFRRHGMYAQCMTSYKVDCSEFKTESEANPITQCFSEFLVYFTSINDIQADRRPIFETKDFADFCLKTCDKDWTHFCASLVQHAIMVDVYFLCPIHLNDTAHLGSVLVKPERICDGQRDCFGGADESGCKGRYYCKGLSNHWVMASEVCDYKKDCPQGDDECQACSTNSSGVASDQDMVQHGIIRYYMVISAAMIILLNMFAVYEVYSQKPESITGKVDRLILIVLCFYDMVMGCCVGFTFAKSMMFSGEYCLSDFDWRASLQCKLLGFFFSFSVHGSLVMISLLSFTRCHKLVFDRTTEVNSVGYITAACLIVNALHSALPIIPISAIQDIFRASLTFSNNPFIDDYDPSEIDRIYSLYRASHNTHSPDVSFFTKLEKLNNISSKAGIFDPEELGYYGYSPLCIQNIYGIQSSLVWYKIIYMTSIGLLLALVSISYIFILYHAFKTSKNAQQGAANQINNNNMDLGVKVMLMIGSQLGCWIAVMVMMTIYGLSQQV